MSVYASDHRVQPHPEDGTWIVFSSDYRTEFNVVGGPGKRSAAFDADGARLGIEGDFDAVVRELIGAPR